MSKNGRRARRTLARMCFNKVQYESQQLAEAVARRRMREANVELRSYACPVCHSFHLTSRVH